MQFSDLVSDVRLFEAQLAAATRGNAPTRSLESLIRKVAQLNDRLERHRPATEAEHRDMIAFFTSRASRGPWSTMAERYLDFALNLAQHSALPPPRSRVVPQNGARPASDPLDTGMADPEELSRHIARSPDRLMALNQSNRYIAVSPGNAAYYNTTPARMIDLHLEQVIGKRRYLDRAAPALDRAMSNGPTDYVYALPVGPGRTPFIRCEIVPIRDRTERLYCAVLRLTDVTASVQNDAPA